MKFTNLLSDDAATEEIGHRITAARLERRMTQADLAAAAGVSKRTVERLEGGASTQLGNLIRCLRALGMLDGFERLLPETPANPIALLEGRGVQRSRVRPSRAAGTSRAAAGPTRETPLTSPWVWGDKR